MGKLFASVFREIAVADGQGGMAVEHVSVVTAGGGLHVAQSSAGIEKILQIIGVIIAQSVGLSYHADDVCFIQQAGVHGGAHFKR